jgi:hypothetical protein
MVGLAGRMKEARAANEDQAGSGRIFGCGCAPVKQAARLEMRKGGCGEGQKSTGGCATSGT